MRGLWVKVNGDRGFADSEDAVVQEVMAETEGSVDHFHFSGEPVGDLTVWGSASRDEGGVLNLFVTALVSSLIGSLTPFVGPAFVSGAGESDLTEEQEAILSGATLNWPVKTDD